MLKEQQPYQTVFSNDSVECEVKITNLDTNTTVILNENEIDMSFPSLSVLESHSESWQHYWKDREKISGKLFQLIIQNKSQEFFKMLTQNPVDVNKCHIFDNWSLLHFACAKGPTSIAKILLEKGSDPLCCTKTMKRTPLHQAVLSNKPETVQILLEHKADINAVDADEWTALHYAAYYAYHECVVELLRKRKSINFNLRNNHKMTCLDLAKSTDIKYLILACLTKQQVNFESYTNESLSSRNRKDFVQKYLHQQSSKIVKNKIRKFSNTQSVEIKEEEPIRKKSENFKKKSFKKPVRFINIIAQNIQKSKQTFLENLKDLNPDTADSLQNYQQLRMIGKGGFGQVYLIRKKKATQLYALKKLDKKQILSKNLKRYVYAQRSIMINIECPFIMSARSTFQDERYLYIVMEYCPCGDLANYLLRRHYIPEHQVKIYACQIALALQKLHEQGILFRDLKPSNILIDSQGHLKLTDFGLAKKTAMSYTFLGSMAYLAPEMLVDNEMKQHGPAIDWYMFGIFIFQLLTGNTPFYEESQVKLFEMIKNSKIQFPKTVEISDECKDLILRLLEKNPQLRLSNFGAVSHHKWFCDIDWAVIQKKQSLFNIEKNKMPQVPTVIPSPELRKKITNEKKEISQEKYEYFLQWNYFRN